MAQFSRNPREASTVFSQVLCHVDLTACPLLGYTPLSLNGGSSQTFSEEDHMENSCSPDESMNSFLPAFLGGLSRAEGDGGSMLIEGRMPCDFGMLG